MNRLFTSIVVAAFVASNLIGITGGLAPQVANAVSCERGAVPALYNYVLHCGNWLSVLPQDTSAESVWGAHKPGSTKKHDPVSVPLQIQLSVFRNTTVRGCSLMASVRFKWNGIPGAVGPSETDIIQETVPEIFNLNGSSPNDIIKVPGATVFKGLLDTVNLDIKSRSLGWNVRWSNLSTLVGANGLGTKTENWDFLRPGSTSLAADEQGNKGGMRVGDVALFQDKTNPDFVHFISSTQFRESHNRTKEQRPGLGLADIWYTSSGQFLWSVTKASKCEGSALSISANYLRTETDDRERCEYNRMNDWAKASQLIVGSVPIAGNAMNVLKEAAVSGVIGFLLDVKVKADPTCRDRALTVSTPSSKTFFP